MKATALRACIYMLLAIILATNDEFAQLTRDSVAQWNWFDWLKLSLTIVGSSVLILRAYIDSSHQRNIGAIPQTPPTAPTTGSN